MQRKTRIWIGLGAAVMVGGTSVDRTALAWDLAGPDSPASGAAFGGPERLFAAQAEGGEGGPGEGGGQVLGTITEFRLSSTVPGAFDYDAAAQVTAYGELVHGTYVAAQEAAKALREAIAALLDDPSPEAFEAARQAWRAARDAYLRTEAFQFYAGPVDAPGGPLPRLNSWPVDADRVAGIIGDPSVPLDFRGLARMNQAGGAGEVTTGLHVVELLLWGEDGDREHSDFVAGVGDNDRRGAYLSAAAQLLVNDLGLLVAAWAPGRNNYRAAVEAMDQRNALGRAFNGMTVLVGYEIPLRRIGAGLFPANENFQPSPFSDTSTADNRFAFEGARDVYYETGLDALIAGADAGLAAEIDAAFARAETALLALDAPYARFLAPAAGSRERATAEQAVRALTDLGRELRRAGNRLGVLVVVPGL
ncbi:MAG TPA: imelysin family protein [Amaricoccus sp.]|uniref:imelysin family protein n=1 Tax=Amaricoccus sp. TaxID=1872485 RepID=UPI002B8F6442|nr:imelysin family protein [Amaricoccus sp.]HMQ93707.1 imelysin family protein [Amaricoccus sp.]HMR52824.1 imelysin family protein [Amaricoccus sp.]HMR60238.1 imelysin family protein [Amaricoccus sp.]HMT99759.1 imelysin family protein [Amaricoccus sp.]